MIRQILQRIKVIQQSNGVTTNNTHINNSYFIRKQLVSNKVIIECVEA